MPYKILGNEKQNKKYKKSKNILFIELLVYLFIGVLEFSGWNWGIMSLETIKVHRFFSLNTNISRINSQNVC